MTSPFPWQWLILIAIAAALFVWFARSSNSKPKRDLPNREMLSAAAQDMKSKLPDFTVDQFAYQLRQRYGDAYDWDYDAVRKEILILALANDYKFKDFDGSVSQEERVAERTAQRKHGVLKPNVICPHCQVKGKVRSKSGVERTTSRVNSLAGQAIGLGTNSSKEVTVLHCSNCDMEWNV